MGGVVQGNAHILVQKFAFWLQDIGMITDVVLWYESKQDETVWKWLQITGPLI